MNNLQVFTYEQNEVRTVSVDGNPWWVLKDVCDVLGLSDTSKVAERLDNDELTRVKLRSGGQDREMWVINEPGLYNVILRSDKAEAKKFKRWITHEVLPLIRKTGAYISDISHLSPQLQVLINIETEQRKQAARLAQVERRQEEIVDIIALSPINGRKKINTLLNKMAQSLGGDVAYQDVRKVSYERLESRASCDLSIRVLNKQRRMSREGAPQSKINAVSKLDVIFDNPRLLEIYFAIVKEMAVQAKIDVSEVA